MNSETTLHVVFQPFYNLGRDALQGFEALARLEQVNGGAGQSLAEFFAGQDAETIRTLDLKVLDRALQQLAEWEAGEERHDLIMSVNISGSVMRASDIIFDISSALGEHDLPGDRLLVDSTTAAFRTLDLSAGDLPDHLARLRDRGVSLCLDSFGEGDLDLLPWAAEIPIDIIKVDPRLLNGDKEAFTRVVEAIQEAGLPVVAAGVETAEQLQLVRDLGCEWAQGFYLGRPVSADEARDFPHELTLG